MALHYQVHQSKSEFMYTLQMTCLAFHEGLPANGKKLTVQVHYTIMAARFVHCRLVYNYVASQHLSHTVCTCTIQWLIKARVFHSASQTKYILQVYPSQQDLIVMKLVLLTTVLLLCAVLATTVTAAPSTKLGKNTYSSYHLYLLACFSSNTVQSVF